MKIRDKTLVILGITFIFLFVFLMVASEQIMGNSFEQLEKDDVSRNVGRATAAMDAKLAVLDMTTYDYAVWDATSFFVQGQDEGYIDVTLSPEIISNLDASMVLFYDSTDKLYYAVAVDPGTTERTNVSTTVLDCIAANELLFSHPAPDSQVSGIINSPEGPLLIASHPITQSSGVGPITGTLIFAKFIDAELIKKLAETTSLSLNAEVFNQERAASYTSSPSSTSKEDSYLNINYVSEASVIGTTVLNDINGKPVLFLDVEMPRDIYQQGRSAIKYMFTAILVMGLVFELALSFSLEKSVLSRISLLNTNLTEITKKGSLSSRINMKGKDEISDLAGNINYMLQTLEENKKALEAHVLETLDLIESDVRDSLKLQRLEEENRQRLETVLSSIISGVVLVDTETSTIVDANPIAEEMIGLPKEQIIGKSCHHFICPADEGKCPILDFGSKVDRSERVLLNKDGNRVPILKSVVPIKISGKKYLVESFVDLTKIKQAEDGLIQAKITAETANRAKSEFLATMSHELRTPLNSVIGFSDLMIAGNVGELSQQQKKFLGNISTSGKHLLALINNILDISKIEAGKMELNYETFAVKETFTEVKQLTSPPS